MRNLSNAKTKGLLPFRSLFVHAWDLASGEIDPLLEWMEKAGLNTLCLAATYHRAWLIHPQHKQHRAYRTEGDVCYFRPNQSCYGKTRLHPQMSRIAAEEDCFEEAGKRIGGRFNLVAWTVGAHNSTLGLAHPQLTVQNVYGDRLPHALCPNQSDVNEYLKALCRDLAGNYPLWGIQLEAFGWMPFAHGHHHERDLVALTPLEQELMGLCVCPACTTKAQAYGVDVNEVKLLVKSILDSAFREAPQRPKGHPKTTLELEARFVELGKFQSWRRNSLNTLLTEIKTQSLAGTRCRLLLQSEFDLALATVADGFGCSAFQQTPAQTKKICRSATGSVPRNWHGLMQCFVQLGMGIPRNEKQLRVIITAIRDGGCNGINFYNRSEAPPKMLSWLERTLPAFAE